MHDASFFTLFAVSSSKTPSELYTKRAKSALNAPRKALGQKAKFIKISRREALKKTPKAPPKNGGAQHGKNPRKDPMQHLKNR